ncbi:hypothetical protein HN51_055920 [Arachis hypogaea]|uniref:Ubiquitin thioesterase OTU n=1 Tax=Arachis hypogaea TaxID=3818 RepID=A0A444XSJ4_ARAHY|nr:uncharacterized protein LOC107619558 [Arachis ipaensis]XP_025676458.1 uncharacterized protein LOC112776485 [Arachis hypogaea]QHN78695.1 OTU domain-containing protein [Arachis hypogaea]RYQ92456.1 hypothetical protein Ahy_B09g098688 [Arachis hypogaea]
MLRGVLCATRPKPWILSAAILHASLHHSSARLLHAPPLFPQLLRRTDARRHHSSACNHGGDFGGGGAASIWHAIMPCGGGAGSGKKLRHRGVVAVHHHDHELKGEGSWNVAWDARPARWLHRPDSAWLLFGVCACLAPPVSSVTDLEATPPATATVVNRDINPEGQGVKVDGLSSDYRVTGVLADGRCLFRAIAHGACLRNGEAAPDERRQRELADELRAQVVEELMKRREETEWFIEGDFDTYVKRIQQPYVWGGEPELLMASHVLKTPISVFMRDTSSLSLVNIAKYGEEYRNEKDVCINVLFHGYGHYDILETLSTESCLESSA